MQICLLPRLFTRLFRHAHLRRSAYLACVPALLALLACPHVLVAQLSAIRVLDNSALHVPAGARVAIVEFDDMECPTCAYYNPVLLQAAEHYRIPWIRHDFIIPYHNWSSQAAVYARWFDTRSKAIGDGYRDYIFASQPSIDTPATLRNYTVTYARSKGLALPFSIDPQGKLAAEVSADTALGKRIGVDATPTIFIVTSAYYKQVLDPNRDLYGLIDRALADTRGH